MCFYDERQKVEFRMQKLSHSEILPSTFILLPLFFSGDHSGEETRVPIPNTTVKGPCGDGTVVYSMGE